MASYQRVALYLLFDSIEQDLIRHIRVTAADEVRLTIDERTKADHRIKSRADSHYDADSELDLLQGLDIAEKYDVLLRHSDSLSLSDREYFKDIGPAFKNAVTVRNSVMHARPLTIDEYSRGFSFAQTLLRSRSMWPTLAENYLAFNKDPSAYTARSIEFLDDPGTGNVLSNLPSPEHDDTGFLPRPELERELKKRLLGRNPVITILGEGGNGKTALALQVLHGLVTTNDHSFDAIVWTSAKTSILTPEGVTRMGNDIVDALSLIEDAASFEPGDAPAYERLYRLLSENSVLLVIDNLETVQGDQLKKLAEDIPGNSKLLLTSRVPLGNDFSIHVGELSDKDAIVYIRRLFDAYEVRSLRGKDNVELLRYIKRLHNKPLLIKWFVLGVKSGVNPDKIVVNPEVALKFCLENVINRLSPQAQIAITALATITSPLSSQILEHVTELNARDVETSINELGRFGMIELLTLQGSEQLYRLRPFARSYVVRVISPKPDITTEIRSKFSRIESQYQNTKALTNYNPYSLKNFKVRSPAEMLAAQKLGAAVRCALNGQYDEAYKLIDTVKISDPAYFEVHRAHAFIAHLQGDMLTAANSYESAIELAPDQPQLYFFYACMLMRGIDSLLADVNFRKAIEIDPLSNVAHREAARNCFMTGDFQQASDFLDKSEALGFKSHKDRVVYTDLRIQLYRRLLTHRVQSRDWVSASEAVNLLADFLYRLDLRILDERMTEHIIEVIPWLTKLIDSGQGDLALPIDLKEWILLRFVTRKTARAISKLGAANGTLKRQGLQQNYGFLVSDDGRETFVHESDAGQDLWDKMLDGARVSYEIVNSNGRTKAISLRALQN